MAEYIPSELQLAILGNLMYSCAKGLAFKTMIQDSWFKISLKRLDKTLNTRSQETFNSEMVRLFLTIDELPNLTDDMRLKFHREIINLRWRSKDQIDKARRWMIACRNITLNKLQYLSFALQRQCHYMTDISLVMISFSHTCYSKTNYLNIKSGSYFVHIKLQTFISYLLVSNIWRIIAPDTI